MAQCIVEARDDGFAVRCATYACDQLDYAAAHLIVRAHQLEHDFERLPDVPLAGGSRDRLKRLKRRVRQAARQLVSDALTRHVPGVKHVKRAVAFLNATAKTGRVRDKDKAAILAAEAAYAGDEERARALEEYGYHYHPEVSDEEVAVWSNALGHLLVAFRGTVNKDDVVTDSQLAIGRLEGTERWRRSIARMQAIDRHFNVNRAKQHIMFAGHSLGGTLALHMASRYPHSYTVALNPGAGTGKYPRSRAHVYSVRGDAVSALAPLTTNTGHELTILEPEGTTDLLNVHGMHQFKR